MTYTCYDCGSKGKVSSFARKQHPKLKNVKNLSCRGCGSKRIGLEFLYPAMRA